MRLWPLPWALPSKRLLLVASFLLATALVYAPSSVALGRLWLDTADKAYTHGFLILLTSLWLLARDRERLDAAPIRAEPVVLPALLIASAAWVFFWRAAVQDFHLLLLPILALIAILAAFGRSVARIVAFPVLFLNFAMPIWSDLHRPLQLLSIKAVGALIWITGLPAYVTGDIVHLPAGALVIEEGCSGLHYVIVGTAMATLYGEISRDRPRRRLLLVASMTALALVANWTRIFVIAVAAYATDMRTFLVTVDHYWFGWALFAVFFAGFLWAAGRLSPTSHMEEPAGDIARTTAQRGRLKAAPVLAALGCLFVLPLTAYLADSIRSSMESGVAIDWATAMGDWHMVSSAPSTDWTPQFKNPTAVAQRRYADARGEAIDVFTVAYRSQRQGAKLLQYGNSLLGSRDPPRLVHEGIVKSAAGPWREMRVRDSSGVDWLIWSRYRIGSRDFVRPRLSQLWYGIAAIAGDPVSSLSAVRAECEPSCRAARQRLARASSLLPAVQTPRAKGGTS
jgi:EpsI family protein